MGYDEPSSKRQAKAFESPVATKPVAAKPAGSKRPPRWPRRILLAILALGAGGYLAANPDALQKIAAFGGAQQAGQGAGRGAPQAPPVRIAVAETRDVAMVVRTIGTVLANATVVVKPQIDGPLLSVGFREGQMVKKGDLLFRIDPAPFGAAVRQAEANVARDQAQLASAEADAGRAVQLAERGIVSAQQRDQLVANAKALAASVAADQAALERARLNLGYTTIRSPIDGKTGSYTVHPGNQVHANDQAGLITITQIQPVKIAFNLPQVDLPQLQDRMNEGALIASVMLRSDMMAAAATAEDNPENDIPMKVDFIGNAVDERTGTIELRATFENPDLRLVPGELVEVSVRKETLKQTVTVPREAVNVGQEGNYVFVVDNDMKAQPRPVRVLYQDQSTAALGSGVERGERVVIDGQLRLTPGIAVTIVDSPGGNIAAPDLRLLNSGAGASSEGTASKSASPQEAGRGAGRRGG